MFRTTELPKKRKVQMIKQPNEINGHFFKSIKFLQIYYFPIQ